MEAADLPTASEGSALGRMFNVLAAPGEVFQEIKERPVAHSNWLIPAVISMLVGIAIALTLFSREWVVHEITQIQEKAVQQQVTQGKLTQTQADQYLEGMKRFGGIGMQIFGSVMAVGFAFGVPFFWGLIVWLVGTKFLKGDFELMKAVEAVGIAMTIYILAGVISTLVTFVMGTLTSLSPAFFVKDFDFNNRSHLGLAMLNPFYLWFLAAIASATAVLSGVSWGKAAGWMIIIWAIHRGVMLAINMGQFLL